MKTIAILAITAVLSSCAGIPPIAIKVAGAHGVYGYSSKRGVWVELNPTK